MFENKKNHFESQIFALFDKAAKLGNASEDTCNWEGWLIFKDILNRWVAEGIASDTHDFKT